MTFRKNPNSIGTTAIFYTKFISKPRPCWFAETGENMPREQSEHQSLARYRLTYEKSSFRNSRRPIVTFNLHPTNRTRDALHLEKSQLLPSINKNARLNSFSDSVAVPNPGSAHLNSKFKASITCLSPKTRDGPQG